MDLPHSKLRQSYIDEIKLIEANLQDTTTNDLDYSLLVLIQKRLDKLAGKYQYNEELGTARYKLYELQALVYYFEGRDSEALDFIDQAIEMRDGTYTRAEKIKARILAKDRLHHKDDGEPPLQLQSLIKGQRSAAIIMAILSVISIYAIPWTIFYIILAAKLNPRQVPSRGLIKAAAIVTLPLCLGIIPIIIDIEFWRMNRRLREYDELGTKAFTSNKGYLAAEPKRKKGRVIVWSILLSVLAILIVLIIVAMSTSSYSNQSSSTTSLAENAVSELKSDNTFILPQKVDDTTTLIDVTSSGNTVQYHYQITDVNASGISNESLHDSVEPKICSNSSTRKLLDAGVAMEYLYDVYGTSEHYSVYVEGSECT